MRIPPGAHRSTCRCPACGKLLDAATWWNGWTNVTRVADWYAMNLISRCPQCGECLDKIGTEENDTSSMA